ncbi:unnamed protein product [Cuscuta epithymum]|uniref:F-box domain-containing protein n=1 Tax=Cuscuta epithymum TaxID=186058 RepID=A0AAV0DFE5_9ASTE|nr:unnamed protein product [Cuscuta epithymum]
MADCGGSGSASEDERKDFISALPTDLKHRILECLDCTRDAARTSVLSTQWKDVWLQLKSLLFGESFFRHAQNNAAEVITPVKKFSVRMSSIDSEGLQQSELHEWCLYLSENGIVDLNISVRAGLKLPICVFSCATIRHLELSRFDLDCALLVNSGCLIHNIRSLVFNEVKFQGKVEGSVPSVAPKLEKLSFYWCEGINSFQINAPNLTSLSVTGFAKEKVERRWFMPHLKSIKSLCLSVHMILCEDVALCLKSFMRASYSKCPCRSSKLLDGSASYFIREDLDMLETVKIEMFKGCKLEMAVAKEILSRSPSLLKMVIQENPLVTASTRLSRKKFLNLPRASEKVQIDFTKQSDYDTGYIYPSHNSAPVDSAA